MSVIEHAVTADLAALIQLELQAQTHPWSEKLMAATLVSDRVFIIRDGARIIAYAAFNCVLDETTLLNTTVAPDYRRRGLAQHLLLQALHELQQQGAKTCFLEVRESNLAAIELYRKMAFSEVGVRKNYYPCDAQTHNKSREDAVLMTKELTSC